MSNLKRKQADQLGNSTTHATTAHRSRSQLTVQDWLTVFDWMDQHPSITQPAVVRHFETLQPGQGRLVFSQSSLSRKLAQKEELLARVRNDPTSLSDKRRRIVQHSDVDVNSENPGEIEQADRPTRGQDAPETEALIAKTTRGESANAADPEPGKEEDDEDDDVEVITPTISRQQVIEMVSAIIAWLVAYGVSDKDIDFLAQMLRFKARLVQEELRKAKQKE
ncbi:uncharacterized protein JCM15063_002269 [Sporobolomyces koalae]|uniref:uncharacterized protein n=1 Tax=Sporobolomyces koalae TaxID=500713 RepID=UPI00317EEB97